MKTRTLIAKHVDSGRLYEVSGIAFSTRSEPLDDVCRCQPLSFYDGMPIGESRWIPAHELDFGIQHVSELPRVEKV